MKEVTMTFTKEELELLFKAVSDKADKTSCVKPDEFTEFDKLFRLGARLRHEIDKMNVKCPLYNICNHKTGSCVVLLPDEGCPYYRYFKDLIKRKEGKIKGE